MTEIARAATDPLFGPRLRERPRPSLADALAAGGGLVVVLGVLLIAIDLMVDDDGDLHRLPATFAFVALLAVGYALLFALPGALRPAAVTVVASAVPGIFGFLILVEADDFDDVRAFLLCCILAWTALFVLPRSRGRAIYVALVALFAYFWVLGEVAGVDESFDAAPVPTPRYSTPAALYGALQGGSDDAPVAVIAAARAGQVGIEDLDPDDELFPLALECDTGDMAACDELFATSPFGSDFEEFGGTCGGREEPGFDDYCDTASGDPGDDFPDDFSDDFGDLGDGGGDFSDDFGDLGDGGGDFGGGLDDQLVPLDPTPLSEGDDKSLEVGVVSLLFALGYLGGARVLDTRRWSGLATALVIPGVIAASQAAGALGDASGTAIVGGLLTMAAGLAVGLTGWFGSRRFAAWIGGAIASVGALIIAGDVSDTEGAANDGDLIGPGIITILFGALVVALGLLIAWLVESRRRGPGDGAPHGGDLPGGPAPFETAPAPAAPGDLPTWTPPGPPAPAPQAWAPPPAAPPAPPADAEPPDEMTITRPDVPPPDR